MKTDNGEKGVKGSKVPVLAYVKTKEEVQEEKNTLSFKGKRNRGREAALVRVHRGV